MDYIVIEAQAKLPDGGPCVPFRIHVSPEKVVLYLPGHGNTELSRGIEFFQALSENLKKCNIPFLQRDFKIGVRPDVWTPDTFIFPIKES